MAGAFSLETYGITVKSVTRNATPAQLYEDAIRHDGSTVTSTGALVSFSGDKTGRSP